MRKLGREEKKDDHQVLSSAISVTENRYEVAVISLHETEWMEELCTWYPKKI